MTKQKTQSVTTVVADDPTMTLEEYLRAIIEDQKVGGRTFPQSAVVVLIQHRPLLAERVWQGNREEILYHAENQPWVFLYYIIEQWDRR